MNKLCNIFVTVSSSCLCLAFTVFLIWYWLEAENSSFLPFMPWVAVALILALFTGFISLYLNFTLNNGPTKIFYSFIIVIIPCLIFLAGLADFLYATTITRAEIASKKKNLYLVGTELMNYAKSNNNRLPDSNDWCDVLIEYNGDIEARLLAIGNSEAKSKDGCSFAFNKNLSGHDIDDIDPDVILLFEADGEWNFNGTSDLIEKYVTPVFLLKGSVCLHTSGKKRLRDCFRMHIDDKYQWECITKGARNAL